MTTRIVSLFRPAKTSVRHDEVSSLSINPVIELRERKRDMHTEEVKRPPYRHSSVATQALFSFLFAGQIHAKSFAVSVVSQLPFTSECVSISSRNLLFRARAPTMKKGHKWNHITACSCVLQHRTH